MESIKTLAVTLRFLGWSSIIIGFLFFLPILPTIFSQFTQTVFLLQGLTFTQRVINGVVFLSLAQALLKRERWAFYVGSIIFFLFLLQAILEIFFIRFSFPLVISIGFNILFFFLLIKEIRQFIEQPKEKISQLFRNPHFIIVIVGTLISYIISGVAFYLLTVGSNSIKQLNEQDSTTSTMKEVKTLAKKVVNDYLTTLVKKDFKTADSFIRIDPEKELLKNLSNRTISFTIESISNEIDCSGIINQFRVEKCYIVRTKVIQYEYGQKIGFNENDYQVAILPENQPHILIVYPGKYIITNYEIYAQNFYKVQLSLNSEISKLKPCNIGDCLIDILQLEKPTPTTSFKNIISLIVYDSTQKSPYKDNNMFNHDYLILLEPGAGVLSTQKMYKNTEFSATASMADPKLLPFIQDSSYCEADTDCSVGNNFCSYASFNKFRIYIDVWGCEMANYPQENEKELLTMCDATKQHPEIKYSGSKCINNKCIAQNREVICKNETLP